jgi:glycosyltransferase involved in cell wall biosynthesis
MLIPGLDRIGGAERQVLLLAKGLVQRGWRVSVVALSGLGGEAAGELRLANVEFTSLGMRKGLADPRGWLRFHRWLKEHEPDVVHAHLPHAAWMARWSRLASPVRVMVDTLHSSATGTIGRRLGYRWSGWLADAVTAVSQAVAETHLAAGMVDATKLRVLPNGVDALALRSGETEASMLRRDSDLDRAFLWLAAGRLHPVKDYETLLRAMVSVPEPAQLAIAGSGPCESDLRQLSIALGLAGRVRFLGFEPDVSRWMRAADGFVLSSRWEGLPMALLEAAACGLPVVATDVPGTREVVVEGRTGWLAPAASPEALAERMRAVMEMSVEDRKAVCEQAMRLVAERFSLQSVLNRWEALYSELLESNPTPVRYRRST